MSNLNCVCSLYTKVEWEKESFSFAIHLFFNSSLSLSLCSGMKGVDLWRRNKVNKQGSRMIPYRMHNICTLSSTIFFLAFRHTDNCTREWVPRKKRERRKKKNANGSRQERKKIWEHIEGKRKRRGTRMKSVGGECQVCSCKRPMPKHFAELTPFFLLT